MKFALILFLLLPTRFQSALTQVDREQAQAVKDQSVVLQQAVDRRDWKQVLAHGRRLSELATRGSDVWFEAQRRLVLAHWTLWNPADCERVARGALNEAAEQRVRAAGEHRTPRSALGPLSPATAGRVIEMQIRLAFLKQAASDHKAALGHLSAVTEFLRRPEPVASRDAFMRRAVLALGSSLIVEEQFDEARKTLEWLQENFPGTLQARLAATRLNRIPGVEDSYRGKFVANPKHAQLRAAVYAALPRVRARLAGILGWPEAEIPTVFLGVADGGDELSFPNAFTVFDPRRPDFGPSIVVIAEGLALGRHDIEKTLLHELTHASMLKLLGRRHEELPGWLAEGLAQVICGEFEQRAEDALALRLLPPPGERKSPSINFGEASQPGFSKSAESFLILALHDAAKGRGVARLVEALSRGASTDEALRSVMGVGLSDYRPLAIAFAEDYLHSHWKRSEVGILALDAARDGGPQMGVDYAQHLLRQENTLLVEGYAMRVAAEGLEQLGRFDEAERAWGALVEAGIRHPMLLEVAMLARVRCLTRLGRGVQSRALLQLLVDASGNEGTRQVAERLLRTRPASEQRK